VELLASHTCQTLHSRGNRAPDGGFATGPDPAPTRARPGPSRPGPTRPVPTRPVRPRPAPNPTPIRANPARANPAREPTRPPTRNVSGGAFRPSVLAAHERALAADLGATECCDDGCCGGIGHFDEGGVVGDLDGADLAAADAGFIGDGADQVLRPDAGVAADTDEDAGRACVLTAAGGAAGAARAIVATGT
jgi:hypothetical protein